MFRIAWYEIIKNARDFKMLLIVLFMPIVMILILGSALDGPLKNDISGKITAGYVNHDTGVFGKQLDAFLNSKEIQDKIKIVKADNEEDGKKAVDKGETDVLIVIPENLSGEWADNEKQTIYLYGQKNVELVETLLKAYTSTFNAVSVVAKMTGEPVQPHNSDYIERISADNLKMPRAIDYYSIMTLLQFLMMGAIFGVFITAREQGTDLHIRLNILPIGRWMLLTGRMLGNTVYLFAISILVMVFSKYVYHANLDGNLIIILLTLFIFCMTMIILGMLIGLLVKSMLGGLGIVFIITFFLASASGSISPAATIPLINIINPDYYAKILMFGSIYSYPSNLMLESMVYLLIFPVACFAGLVLFLRRVRYDSV